MAAITLADISTLPTGHTVATATTWQEFTLGTDHTHVTIHNEDSSIAMYVAFDNMGTGDAEQPADGGAVGTHRILLPAGTSRRWALRDRRTGRVSTSVFVASASGTPTVTVEPEQAV
jgi:hypothetical protein